MIFTEYNVRVDLVRCLDVLKVYDEMKNSKC